MSFKDHFSTNSHGYAQHRPHYPRALADFLAAAAHGRALALDVGCGSGQFALLLADHFDKVVATDASASQIQNALPHPRIDYRCAPAEASGLPDASVDLITAAQAAHWFDLPRFYAEARRIAKPGAPIALITYGLSTIDPAVDAVIDRFYRGPLDPFWPPERHHVESAYANLDFPFTQLPTPSFHMHASWDLPALLGYLRTWSALRAFEAAHGPSTFTSFTTDLTAAWQQTAPAATARDIRWPLTIKLGIITR